MAIGFEHDNYQVEGVIQEVDWGEWESRMVEGEAFGVDGMSVIEGGLRTRMFSFNMILDGFEDAATRDTAIQALELNIGVTGQFQAWNVAELFISLQNVRLRAVKQGRSGLDPYRGFYRAVRFTFQQLVPPAPEESDDDGESVGNG